MSDEKEPQLTSVLMGLLTSTLDGVDVKPLSAAQSRQAARLVGFTDDDLSFETMADSALETESDPEMIAGARELDGRYRPLYEQARKQARRLVRDGVSPERIVADIVVMIEQGTRADAESWSMIAAFALVDLIHSERALASCFGTGRPREGGV